MSWADVSMLLEVLMAPLSIFFGKVVSYFPSMFIAFLFLLLGYLVSKSLGLVLRDLLSYAKLDGWVEKTRRHKALGALSSSRILAGLLRWYLFSLFMVVGFSFLTPGDFVTNVLMSIALFIPHLLVAVLLFFLGLILADLVSEKLSRIKHVSYMNVFAPFAHGIIVVLGVYAALLYLVPTNSIPAEVIFLGINSLVLIVSVAVGVSLAHALRPEVEKATKLVRKQLAKK